MKILLSSHFFLPSVGGIERVSNTLAEAFSKAGHEVRLITSTKLEMKGGGAFEIIRRPGPLQLIRLVQWCDVFFHNNISLQTAWPLLLVHKPWVIAHHTWIARMSGRKGIRDHLKLFVIRHATNISISHVIAGHLGVASTLIYNPYRDDLFRITPGQPRDLELVFLGRLVTDKGVDLLLDALGLLKIRNVTPRLTVIGDGPEMSILKGQTRRLGLDAQVNFVGIKIKEELVALLNRHKLIVIPSRWQEPFGLVALEGIACGCVAVGAQCGGLPDAIGPAGVVFPCGDVEAMAGRIDSMLGDESEQARCRAAAPRHLQEHSSEVVARRYIEVLEKAVESFVKT